jgi:hypothetical protein
MDEVRTYTVDGKPVRWSWESMWALACEVHRPWILAGYDLDYLPWLEAEIKAFRTAHALVYETIEQWNAIERLSTDLYAQGLITKEDYLAESKALQEAIRPEMVDFNPGALPDALKLITTDGRALVEEHKRATWNPPVTWT